MTMTKEGLRARFVELSGQAAAIRTVSTPLRAQRDSHVQQARETEDAMNAAIREAELGLFDIEQERAMIVRALNGKTTDPAELQGQ